MKEDIRYKVNPDYICRKIAGEYVIVPTGENNAYSNAMLTPNETAVFLWEQFRDYKSIAAVVQSTKQIYDIDEETLKQEVERFVSELLQVNIMIREEVL